MSLLIHTRSLFYVSFLSAVCGCALPNRAFCCRLFTCLAFVPPGWGSQSSCNPGNGGAARTSRLLYCTCVLPASSQAAGSSTTSLFNPAFTRSAKHPNCTGQWPYTRRVAGRKWNEPTIPPATYSTVQHSSRVLRRSACRPGHRIQRVHPRTQQAARRSMRHGTHPHAPFCFASECPPRPHARTHARSNASLGLAQPTRSHLSVSLSRFHLCRIQHNRVKQPLSYPPRVRQAPRSLAGALRAPCATRACYAPRDTRRDTCCTETGALKSEHRCLTGALPCSERHGTAATLHLFVSDLVS